jgi:hypothetical protein
MLDKLIGDIKEKFQKKTQEDSGDSTNPNVTIPNDTTLKELLNESEETAPAAAEKIEQENHAEGKKVLGFKIPTDPKEKKSFFIRIGVALFVIYFAVDEFVLKQAPEDAAAPVATTAPLRKKKKKKPVSTETETAQVGAEQPTPNVETPLSEVTTEAPATDAVPVEAMVDKTTENKASEDLKNDVPTLADSEINKPVQKNEQEKVNVEEVVNGKGNDVIPDLKVAEPALSEPITTGGELNLGTGQNSDEFKVDEKPAPEVKIEEKLNKIITQVDEDSKAEVKEYVAPPNYELAGRGLVYNCVNKHWACVERESYFTCEKNSRWLKKKKKAPECAIQNVYSTDSDCQTTQKYNVQEIVAPKGCKL